MQKISYDDARKCYEIEDEFGVYAELKLAIEKNDRPKIKKKMEEFGKSLGVVI